MSEQTPDTNNGMTDGQDPSMEDILASIRKIIADDDGGQAVTVDVVDDSVELETEEGDVAELAHVDTLDLDILADDVPKLDADIDALIGDMDVESSAALEIPQLQAAEISTDAMDDVLDLEIPFDEPEVDEPTIETPELKATAIDEMMDLTSSESLDITTDEPLALADELDDIIADMDDEIISPIEDSKPSNGLMGGAMAALGLGGAAVASKATVSDTVEPPEDDLSLMLDNMLEDSASYQEEDPVAQEQVVDPAEDLLAELDLSEDIVSEEPVEEIAASDPETATDPDMDLVKSLMADLTEEPLHDDTEVEAALDIDEAEDANTDDVMDEILTMTLDDETKLSEDIAISEIDAPAIDQNPSETLSLKEIAAQAEADAQGSSSLLGKGLAAAAGVGVVGAAAAVSAQDDEPETHDTETDDVDAALSQLDDLLADDTAELETEPHTPEHIIEETTPMARAKKTDAIIDEVTESATAGAFASLTNVVENKAVTAERGDRIGDLVMEALQPMLKEWLDANLKGIVERAVTKEVKRISSGK